MCQFQLFVTAQLQSQLQLIVVPRGLRLIGVCKQPPFRKTEDPSVHIKTTNNQKEKKQNEMLVYFTLR